MATPVHIASRAVDGESILNTRPLGTTVGSTVEIDTTQANGIALQIRTGATLGGVIVVEGTLNEGNAATWAAIPLKSTTGTPTLIVGTLTTLAATTLYRYEIPTHGYRRIRLRVSTALGSALTDLSYVAHTEAPDPFSVVSQNGTWTVTATPTTSGTSYNLNSAASTNLVNVRNTAASLLSLNIFNGTGATAFVKLYNKASAPVVATDIPVMVIPVAAGAFVSPNLGGFGERFSTGLSLAITGAAADTDATAVAVGVKVKATYI